MTRSNAYVALGALLGLVIAIPTVGLAAPRQQGTNVAEGECEDYGDGTMVCKVDGKCYYCRTSGKPDCLETTCDQVRPAPGVKGTVRPSTGMNAPVRHRGVEGEQPTSSEKEGK
jgi:hypothetical protein